MNPKFQRLMYAATRLTRSGSLAAATAAIQSALAGAKSPERPTATNADTDVIDVEAREVPDSPVYVARAPLAGATEVADAPATAPVEHHADDAVRSQPPRPEAFLSGRFGSGVSAREYKLYVPPVDGAQALPLIVMLHGCTQNPDDFAAGTAMNEAARHEGFLVLYPAQSAQANAHRCWNWFKHSHQVRGRGEAAILAEMTQHIIATHGADPSRVYVAGLSAGGAMAAILGHAYPDIFAAIGVHSGLPQGAARDLPSALQAMKDGRAPGTAATTPVIVFHGDADATVHPRNGDNVFATAGDGGAVVQEESGSVTGGRAWTRRIRTGADGKPQAEHWQVHGAPHAWSGGNSSGSYTDPQGPDATKEMLRFFRSHSLRK